MGAASRTLSLIFCRHIQSIAGMCITFMVAFIVANHITNVTWILQMLKLPQCEANNKGKCPVIV